MLNNPTVSKLNEMKLKTMAQSFADPDPALQTLDFDDRFSLMVETEWYAKRNARISRLIARASFPMNACVEDIEYSSGRSIRKKEVAHLSSCGFVESALNIIISGKTGTGKSYLATALGVSACRKVFSVKYFRLPDLLVEVEMARFENRYLRFIENIRRIRILIIDDIGLKAYNHNEARDLLEIAEMRYNKTPTIFVSQVPHEKWYDLFPDPTLADAFMDRVIHNAYIVALDSKLSMREIMASKKLKMIEEEV